ncbi:hypothetical protein BJX63DRAFT_376490 [Aspergillus granulosus]|uniref:Uncharacterized protein n=1 Tax=Aspergillus granulosus TaxID=176169 RepID=A0ABR4I3U5_9EURO
MVRPYRLEFEALEFLLEIGADPNMTNYNGDTLIHSLAANLGTIPEETIITAIKAISFSMDTAWRGLRKATGEKTSNLDLQISWLRWSDTGITICSPESVISWPETIGLMVAKTPWERHCFHTSSPLPSASYRTWR